MNLCPADGQTAIMYEGVKKPWHLAEILRIASGTDWAKQFDTFVLPGSEDGHMHEKNDFAVAWIRANIKAARIYLWEAFDRMMTDKPGSEASWEKFWLTNPMQFSYYANGRDDFMSWPNAKDVLQQKGWTFQESTAFTGALPYNIYWDHDTRTYRCQHSIMRLNNPFWRAHRWARAVEYADILGADGIRIRRLAKTGSQYLRAGLMPRPRPEEQGQGWIADWLERGLEPEQPDLGLPSVPKLWAQGHFAPARLSTLDAMLGVLNIAEQAQRRPKLRLWMETIGMSQKAMTELGDGGHVRALQRAMVDAYAACAVVEIKPWLQNEPEFAGTLAQIKADAARTGGEVIEP